MLISFTKKLLLFTAMFFVKFVTAKINFSDGSSSLILSGTDAGLVLGRSLEDFGGTLKITDKTATSITRTSTGHGIHFAHKGSMFFESPDNVPGLRLGDALYLEGGQTLNLNNKFLDEPIKVSGVDNLIFGSPVFTPPIILQDSATTVTLAVNTKLTNNITMNGGSVYLQNDLFLKDDVHLTGSGTVVFNGYSLFYPVYNEPITSELDFIDANDIAITTRTSQTYNTTIRGVSNVVGNGVILDFTGGGSYSLKGGSTIAYFSGLHFKGLGSEGLGQIIMSSSTAAYFTGCTFDLKGTFTQTAGLWTIEGASCKVITGTDDKFVVSGAGTEFRVDGQVFHYESINQLPCNPLVSASGGLITTVNGGRISSNYIPGSSLNTNLVTPSSTGLNKSDVSIYLGSGNTITFFNENVVNPKVMILDFQGNVLEFGESSTSPLVVQQNVTLTIQNTVIKNFDPAKIVLQGSGSTLAKLFFGDGIILEIADDLTIATGVLALTGNTIITGEANSTLKLASQAISFTGAGKLLTIKGLRVKQTTFDGLKSLTDTSTIKFQNCELFMTSTGLTMDRGYVQIADTVKIRGTSETTPEATTTLTFSSKGLFSILSGATLELYPDTVFNYVPSTAVDGGVASVQKRHLVLTDPSSMLVLNKATLNTGTTGLALDCGKIFVNDVVTCKTSYTTGAEFELGSAVNLSIMQGSMFNVDGLLKYVATTYP